MFYTFFGSRNFQSISFGRSHSAIKFNRSSLVDKKRNKKGKYLVENWKRLENNVIVFEGVCLQNKTER